MGSARVQYELERTLPTLQLAVRHGLFDKDVEARSITHKRRQFENALVRHNALADDFHRYVDYEENLEQLRQMRLKRLGDASEIPRAEVQSMQNKSIAHIVSIFERGIKRIRHDFGLWHRYMMWATRRKMRSAVSRIAARALALFPNNIDLWLFVSDNAVNQNLDVTTGRALLQRGLRLNGIAHRHSIQAEGKHRPSKRTKTSKLEVETAPVAIRPAGDKDEDAPTLRLSKQELTVIRLWLEYFRMEFVFLERLRRRRIVLDILDDDQTIAHVAEEEDTAGSSNVPASTDGETAPVSLAQIAKDEEVEEEQAKPTDSIILGAIPVAALKSALSLDSTTAMTPHSHFGFLVSLTALVNSFPFYGDAIALRSRLNNAIKQAMQNRFPGHPTAMLFNSTLPIFEAARETGLERLSEIELKEELQENIALRKASWLARKRIAEMETTFRHQVGPSNTDNHPPDVTESILEQTLEAFGRIGQHAKAATIARSVLDDLRSKILELEEPSDGHMSIQLRLVRCMRMFGMSAKLGQEFDSFLAAYAKRILHDAKRLGVAGVEVKLANLRSRLDVAGTEMEFHRIIDAGMLAYEQHGQDVRFLDVTADSLLMASQSGNVDFARAQLVWRQIIKAIRRKEEVNLWHKWCSWLNIYAAHPENGVPSIEKELKKALTSETMGETAVQQFLLRQLYDMDEAVTGALRTMDWIDKQGIAQAELWKYIIVREQARLKALEKATDQRSNIVSLVKQAFEKLLKVADSPEDLAAYLRFLCFEANAQAEAMERFKRETSRLSKTSVDGKVSLERKWREIMQQLRAAGEDGDDDDDDGGDWSGAEEQNHTSEDEMEEQH